MNLNSTSSRVKSESCNTELFCKLIKTDGDAKRNIVIVHDYFDYHKRYEKLAISLSQNARACVCLYDQRGFGLSGGKRADLSSIDQLTSDLSSIIKQFFNDSQLPLTIIGVGLGGVVSIDFLLKEKKNFTKINFSQIVINPLLKVKIGMSSLASIFKIKELLHNYDIYQHNTNIVEAEKLMADPLAKKILIPKFFEQLKKKTDELKRNFYFLEDKTIFMIGGRGQICDNHIVKLFDKGMSIGCSNVNEYTKSGHDLLFDVENELVIEDILKWLKNLD